MNTNYTHIVLLVDASGSMESTKQATIDGINNFVESQKRLPDNPERNLSFDEDLGDSNKEIKCTASLIMFSGEKRSNNNQGPSQLISGYGNSSGIYGSNLSAALSTNGEPSEKYNYTKLYDAEDIANAIALTNQNYDTFGGTPLVDAFYKAVTECSGFINRLPETERPGRIIFVSITDGEENASEKFTRAQLKTLIEEKVAQNWQFIYLGANQDAFSESQSYGVAKGQALNFVQTDYGIERGFHCLTSNVMSKRMADIAYMSNCNISDMDSSVSGVPESSGITNMAQLINTSENHTALSGAYNATNSTSGDIKRRHFLADLKAKITKDNQDKVAFSLKDTD